MKKKVLSLVLVFAMVLSVSAAAFTVEPRWSYTDSVDVALDFSGSTASCGAVVLGYDGVTKISATVMLQKKSGSSYTTVKTWNETVNSDSYYFDGSYPNCAKGDYRLYVSASVYKGTKSEAVSNYATATC